MTHTTAAAGAATATTTTKTTTYRAVNDSWKAEVVEYLGTIAPDSYWPILA